MTVYVGDVAPCFVRLEISADGVNPDLSTLSAGTIEVLRPDGSTALWTAVVSMKTPSLARLDHVLAEGDVPMSGLYTLRGLYTLSIGGTPRTTNGELLVLAKEE
jgi:hypothetical protein